MVRDELHLIRDEKAYKAGIIRREMAKQQRQARTIVGYHIRILRPDEHAAFNHPAYSTLEEALRVPSFFRHINAYLYFGIRFLSFRITPIHPSLGRSTGHSSYVQFKSAAASVNYSPAIDPPYKIVPSAFTEIVRISRDIDLDVTVEVRTTRREELT